MVDFKALMNRTPEEREAARQRVERAELELARHTAGLIDERGSWIAKILELVESKQIRLSEWERGFIDSMSIAATYFDDAGVRGGRLAILKDRQVVALEGMAAKFLGIKSSNGSAEPAPARPPHPFRNAMRG